MLAYYAWINEFGGGGRGGGGGPVRPTTGTGDGTGDGTGTGDGQGNGNGSSTSSGTTGQSTVLDKVPFTSRYASADDAAIAGLLAVLPMSIKINREYCFAVCGNNNLFYNTIPRPNLDTAGTCTKAKAAACGAGHLVGQAHTHGSDDGSGAHHFTPEEVSQTQPSWLGTPSRNVLKHNPLIAAPSYLSPSGVVGYQSYWIW